MFAFTATSLFSRILHYRGKQIELLLIGSVVVEPRQFLDAATNFPLIARTPRSSRMSGHDLRHLRQHSPSGHTAHCQGCEDL